MGKWLTYLKRNNKDATLTTYLKSIYVSREKSDESINMPSLFGQGGGNSDTKPAITSNGKIF